MLDFKQLDATYKLLVTLKYGGLTQSRYFSKEHITAKYRKEEGDYLFRLEERTGIRINDEPPREPMDLLMIEIGNALYPLSLATGSDGAIRQITNHLTVKEQWKEKTTGLLRDQYTLPLERYIEIGSRNLKTEEALRKSLEKNSFIKLFFLPSEIEFFTFTFENFPERNQVVIFRCQKTRESLLVEGTIRYTAALLYPTGWEGDGFIHYALSEFGEPLYIEATFNLNNPDGIRTEKQIMIQVNEEERKVSGKKNFWNTLLE